jgi:hypothetical protein
MNLRGSFTAETVSFAGKLFCIRKDCFAPLAKSSLSIYPKNALAAVLGGDCTLKTLRRPRRRERRKLFFG